MPTAVLFAPPPQPGMAGVPIVGGVSALDRQLRQVRRAGLVPIVVDDRPLDAGTLDGDLLFIDAGVVLDDLIVVAMAAAIAPAIATWPAPTGFGTERIDAHDSAAGIALYPVELVRATMAELGEWDLAPTLLRAALAAGARRIDLAALPVFDAGLGRDVALVWARPDDADSAKSATAVLIAAAQPGGRDWVQRWLHAPVEDAVVRLLLPLPLPADLLMSAGIVAAAGAVFAFATGWLATGLMLAIVTGPLAGVAAKLARIRCRRARLDSTAIDIAPYAWFAAAAAHFAAIGVEAAWPLASLLTGFMLADRLQRGFFRRLTGRPLDTAGLFEQRLAEVAARRDTLLWTWVPFAIVREWTAGFAVLAAYATAGFFVAQWRVFKRLAARTQLPPAP